MSIQRNLKQAFAHAYTALFSNTVAENVTPSIGLATRPEYGDYQVNDAMTIGKLIGEPPRKIAERIIQKIGECSFVESFEVAGPGFINVKISDDIIYKYLSGIVESPQFGLDATQSKKVVIDYSSVNLAKEMHVGHLRSTIIGDSLARLNTFVGHDVIRQNHVGDWGTQFGMLIAHIAETTRDNRELELSDLETFYKRAKKRFEDPQFADIARAYVVKLQQGDVNVLNIWRRFVDVSMSHCDKVYRKLGVLLNKADIRGESFYNPMLPMVVKELLGKGIAVESDGAIVVETPEIKGREGAASIFMLQKKDGGFLYGTTDLAALHYRTNIIEADKCLYVVDVRQSLHFQQLFIVATRAGYLRDAHKYEHVSFGAVLGEDGKPFKTRSGESVKLVDLLQEAENRAYALVSEKNPALPHEKRVCIAKAVGIGAIKYSDLSRHRTKDYVFDWSTMLSFEGNTAPYLQYAYVRMSSVLKKVDKVEQTWKLSLTTSVERDLALHICRFPEVINIAAAENLPHFICGYLYDLASKFSRFYEECPILTSGLLNVERVRLCQASSVVLGSGLRLLGIDVLDEM